MALRDTALHNMKKDKTQDNIREYKALRNEVNRAISYEKWKRTSSSLQEEKGSASSCWKKAKKLTGQSKFNSPQLIIEGKLHHTSPGNIASALNRQYIQKVRSVISNIPETNIDPLIHFEKAIGRVDRTLSFSQINMCDLVKLVDKMKPTGSAGEDEISMRMIKDARQELQPLFLSHGESNH